jgi:drug/metabolite transporter (DMT)-like permease
MWSLLALLTVGSAPVPPLQLNAVCFGIGGLIGLVWVGLTGGFGALVRVPPRVYVFGTAGLFGYHLLYFSALRMAPAAEAGLIAYLWPLLIVLLSGLLPGEKLRPAHIFGAIFGFAGAALIVSKGIQGFTPTALPGLGLALACAFTWAIYSIVSRRWRDVPTASVAVFCIATAVLSAIAHFALETTVWPVTSGGWVSIVALGFGPVGLAFYIWDVGVKKGDIQLLGTASYAAPLLSTLALVAAGHAKPSIELLFATTLIVMGAALASSSSADKTSD